MESKYLGKSETQSSREEFVRTLEFFEKTIDAP